MKIPFYTIDFETYYASDYSLSKMQTDEYCRDPRFQIIGVSVAAETGFPEWFYHWDLVEIRRYLQQAFDWKNSAVCAHHTQFDGFICTQRMGLRPKLWLDTLAMARTLYPRLKSYSLGAIAQHLGLRAKGTYVKSAIGKRLEDFTPEGLRDYGLYCRDDVIITREAARILLDNGMTPLEIMLIDMTTRMFTEPRFVGDAEMFRAFHAKELARKEVLLAKTVDKSELMSNPKMAAQLQALGVDPPTKISPTTGKVTYAFAKTDKAFTALLEHPNYDVQALVAARLGVKSTIAETRALRFVRMAERGGGMPVYLQHWGAKSTGRLSGGDGMNWQNLPARGDAAVIRKALTAPPGHKVVVGDSSNIELRMVMALAGELAVLQKIAADVDMYCKFASTLLGKVVTKADEMDRRLGKFAMLSCQYGTGAERFREMARMAGLNISFEEALHIIEVYRTTFTRVKQLWWYCDNTVLPAIRDMSLVPVDVNAWFLTNSEGFSLPAQPGVVYTDLKKDQQTGEWSYWSGRARVKLYGAKVVENLTQHAARQVVMWQTARVHERYPVALSVHDEIVCIVPEHEAQACQQYMQESLALAPSWCRGMVPLKGETAIADNYGDAVH